MRTTVDRFGRVVVPKALRDKLGLRAGSTVEIEEANGRISVSPTEESSPVTVRDGVLVFTGAATGDLETCVAAQREDRAYRIAGMRPK